MPKSGTLAMCPLQAVIGPLQDVAEYSFNVVGRLPVRIVLLEATRVTDPPLVVASPVGLLVAPPKGAPRELLAELDGFEHRAVAPPTSAHVVDLALTGVLIDSVNGGDEIGGVDVVSDLLTFVAE